MSRLLRKQKHRNGLILANGGMLTHQYAICLSRNPRGNGKSYPSKNPLPEVIGTSGPNFVETAEGSATIEVRPYLSLFGCHKSDSFRHILLRMTAQVLQLLASSLPDYRRPERDFWRIMATKTHWISWQIPLMSILVNLAGWLTTPMMRRICFSLSYKISYSFSL